MDKGVSFSGNNCVETWPVWGCLGRNKQGSLRSLDECLTARLLILPEQDNDSFKKWLSGTIFNVTYRKLEADPKISFVFRGDLDACNDLGAVTF